MKASRILTLQRILRDFSNIFVMVAFFLARFTIHFYTVPSAPVTKGTPDQPHLPQYFSTLWQSLYSFLAFYFLFIFIIGLLG